MARKSRAFELHILHCATTEQCHFAKEDKIRSGCLQLFLSFTKRSQQLASVFLNMCSHNLAKALELRDLQQRQTISRRVLIE